MDKTKEIKIDPSFFEFDTFKVEHSKQWVGEKLYQQFNIYTGRDEDKHHIFTPYLSFFNFDNYKENFTRIEYIKDTLISFI